MAKCEPLHTPRRGQNWKCDQTPLLRKNRRTRNLSNSARRCEHAATPSSSFNGITYSATKGHTLFLKAPLTAHDCRGACFRCNSSLVRIPYESRQSKGCMSRNMARRRSCRQPTRLRRLRPFSSASGLVSSACSTSSTWSAISTGMPAAGSGRASASKSAGSRSGQRAITRRRAYTPPPRSTAASSASPRNGRNAWP
jgi:hypothetical protein